MHLSFHCQNQTHTAMKNTLLIIIGILLMILFVILDFLPFNTKEGFGLVQIAGTAIGAILVILGAVKVFKK